jgi:phosphatidylglycerophosphate synthase
MIEHIKQIVRAIMRVFARIINKLSRGRVTPNDITLFGLTMHLPIALLIATRHNYWAAGLLLVFGLFDTLDGELARLQHRESSSGRFLDSVTDRIKEIMLYLGTAYAAIALGGKSYMVTWVVAACGSALLTSYVNAAGDAIIKTRKVETHAENKAFRGGLFPFEIRMFILIVGLVSNELSIAIIIIAIGASFTALNRMLRVLRTLKVSNA